MNDLTVSAVRVACREHYNEASVARARSDLHVLLCALYVFAKGSVESTHKVPTGVL